MNAAAGTHSAADSVLATRLRITEIFYSLQGETNRVGLPTVFVRLTGCPLRCVYCDTAYAFEGGAHKIVAEIIDEVRRHNTRYVTVTGGEPLAQKGCIALLTALCDAGFDVSLETGGAIDISNVDPRVARIVDLKTPASGEMARNRYENIPLLTRHDQIKFVIVDRQDYEWARTQLRERDLAAHCEVLFSPAHDQLPARQLADWILEDQLPVRFQLQLHKTLWGNVAGR